MSEQSHPTSKKLAIEALEHVVKVFKSMADRGRYPAELLPYIEGEPNRHFLGKQGWEFINQALDALRLTDEPGAWQRQADMYSSLLKVYAEQLGIEDGSDETIGGAIDALKASSRERDAESFVAGARWARMAAEKAFDDALLDEDAKHFADTGRIRCRGNGTLDHFLRNAGTAQPPGAEPFVVKHYSEDERPIIKGNGFDGLEIGEDRQEAEEFIAWINARLALTKSAGTT